MSAKISGWLLEDIDLESLESGSAEPLATTDIADYYNAPGYSNAYNDTYYNYYNYSDYYNYYNYYNYSNSISVTRHPISQSAQLNEVVTFTVGASNTIDSCQWYVSDSATGSGTAISGATSPTLTITANRDLDGKYYYCVVRRGSNSSTSSRALLTVLSVDAFDIYVAEGSTSNMFFVRANPPTTTITSVSVDDESIATATSAGLITGISVGSTVCTVTGSNGATAQFKITVLPASDNLVVILMNTSTALREYLGISNSIYPNQIANYLRGDRSSVQYNTLEDLFRDIADAIRQIEGSTGNIMPSSFYHRILALTTR